MSTSKLWVQQWLQHFLIKYILRKDTEMGCNIWSSWGTWDSPDFLINSRCVEKRWAAAYATCNAALEERGAPQLGKRGGDCWRCPAGRTAGTHSKASFPPSLLPSFSTTEDVWGEVFIHTRYRHDSSLLTFQNNAFKSQLRPSHLFSVTEQLVVKCRNCPFIGIPWEKPHKGNS